MSDRLDVTAHHEAAHAVVLYRVSGFAGGHITIVPNPDEGILGTASDGISDSFNDEHSVGQIVSCYAGGHSDRKLGFFHEEQCVLDEEIATDQLRSWGWQEREAELREQSRVLVDRHWPEIVAVAEELLRVKTLDDTEVEIIADAAAGVRDVGPEDLARAGGCDGR
jgi:hypothetical protein